MTDNDILYARKKHDKCIKFYKTRPTARLVISVTEHPHTLMRHFNARNDRYIMTPVYLYCG